MAAGAFALWAFWPRGFPAFELASLREYLAAEEQFTKLTLHDTLIEMDREASGVLQAKAGRLKAALGALALAVLVFAVGIAYEGLEAEPHGPAGTTTDAAPDSSATPAGP